MEFSAYLKELGLDEIIADLHNFEDSANDNQKEAIQTMIVAYESAIDGSEDYKALEETLQFTIDKRFSNNQKIDNVIRKHALVSMLILLELSRQGKADFKKWLESIVVSTRTVIDGDEFEEVTTININNDDDSAEEKALAEVTFEEDFLDIPLANRLAGKKWLDEKEISDIVTISESTPGPIAINAATFVGYRTNGFIGACVATLGVVLPSFLIISVISFILNEFKSLKAVQYAFMGIRAAVLALILKALWMMFKSAKKKVISYVIMGAALILTAFLKIDAVFVIIGCGLFGLMWSLLNRKEQSHDTD